MRWLLFVICNSASLAPQGKKRLLAYYLYSDRNKVPSYNAKNIPYKKLTHIIHVALEVNVAGDGRVDIPKDALEPDLLRRAHAARVQVMVCVQGAGAAFKQMAEAPDSRARFASAVREFVMNYGYDGVDIDWEVPQGDLDVAKDVLLMQALRDALPRPRYLLSMATPSEPGPGRYGEYNFKLLNPIVDFYNVMTYDYHGPWVKHAGHNSPLFPSSNDQGHEGSVDESMNLYLVQLGVPAEKINLGTAFYGYELPTADLDGLCGLRKDQHEP